MPLLTSIPFDQYQRYGVASRAIEAIRRDGKPLKILEVGSNVHQLLGKLLPNDSIDYLDLEIPEEMRGNANIIVGDATALELADNSYDIVLSLDVFEHIPQALRSAFLMHTNRVARLLTIVGAPFDAPASRAAEQDVLYLWNQLFSSPYRWLTEHAENGLPNLDDTVKKVKAFGYHTYSIGHGDIELWRLFIKAHFAEVYVGALQPVLSTLYDYYRCNIFNRDFFPVNSYRKFIFASTDLEYLQAIEIHFEHYRAQNTHTEGQALTIHLLKLLPAIALEKMNDLKALVKLDESVAALNSYIATKHQEIATQHQMLVIKDTQINDLYNSSSWRVTAPLRFVSRQTKRLPRILKLALPAIKLGGGLVRTIKKAVKLYLREGIPGIKRGFRMAAMSTQGQLSTVVTQTAPPFGIGNNDYSEWIRQFDTLSDTSRANMHATQTSFALKPLISVLMPTYNTRTEWLIEAIESVRSQIYSHWELCIADDASTDVGVRSVLEHYAKLDSRIKIVIRPENGHISAASNSALELVAGEWVALLDHDDILPEHALFWVAHAINRQPDVRMIYSDEDKTDEKGRRFDPYFKSDWNPDLFYSHNMFSHLGVYQTSLMREVGGFRVDFEGAQDYDLTLRCIEKVKVSQIVHIPRVLYHWRVHAQSTALSADAKLYAIFAGVRSINEHFQRTGVNGKVKHTNYGYQASYDLPAILPLVSIIIPTRNGLDFLKQCVESILLKTTYKNYEIVIVDNGSDDAATMAYLKDLSVAPKITVLYDESPFNYSQLNNRAVSQTRGEVLALLNNDIEVISPNWLSEMVSHALRPGIGAVGAKLWYPDDTLQHGGVVLGIGGVASHMFSKYEKNTYGYFNRPVLIQNYSAVTAACLVIRKSIYQEVGGLNEKALAVAFNDIDFCIRVRNAGYRNVWTPVAEMYHHESATRGYEDTQEKQSRFMTEVDYMKKTWGEQLNNDPAYNPNLTLVGDDFGLAWPSRAPALPQHPHLSDFMRHQSLRAPRG